MVRTSRTLVIWTLCLGVAGCADAASTPGESLHPTEPADERLGDAAVWPAAAEFGLVCSGAVEIMLITIENEGDAELEVVGLAIASGSSAAFAVAEDRASGTLAPGEARSADIAYAPAGSGADSGTLLVYVSTSPEPLSIPLVGSPGGPQLQVLPADIDFGGVPVGETAIRSVDFYNGGDAALTLLDLELVSAWPEDVLWVDALNIWTPLPWALEPGESVRLDLALRPEWFSSPDGAPLGWLEVWSTDCADETSMLAINGWPGGTDLTCDSAPAAHSEAFVGQPAQPTDVLFVVDNSESMLDEQKKLAGNFASFIQSANALAIDYRVAVTTTDMDVDQGTLQGDHPIVKPGSWKDFMDNVIVGTGGSMNERGLAAATASLSSPHAFAPWMRDEALLVLVFVSDEDDKSPGPAADYYQGFVDLKGGDPGAVLVHAIVGPLDGSCDEADPGFRYADVAELGGGSVASICDESFADTLLDFGDRTFASKTQFVLAGPAWPGSVSVIVDGVACETGWHLEADARTVRFDPDAACLPADGAPVEIAYAPACL